MGRLTTHVLDTALGQPAGGVRVALHRVESESTRQSAGTGTLVVSATTNADGRVHPALLEGEAMQAGRYRLTFHMAAYFRAAGLALTDPPFLDEIVIPFGIADPGAHYHVPLLVSPWSFSTYRGS
jgi:5-hydroxyisourate hydrolase